MKKDLNIICQILTVVAICNNFLFYVQGEDCVLKTASDQEKKYLAKLEPLKGKKFEVTDANKTYKYFLGICATAENAKAGVGLLQQQIDDKTKEFNIGRLDDTQIIGGDDWILLKYKGGDQYHKHCQTVIDNTNKTVGQFRQALIMITCEPQLRGEFQVIEENTDANEECYYLLQLGSSVACSPEKDEGLSSGSIFCIILLTGVSLYLIIGFLHQRIVVGAKGLEQIPNYSMWKEFGKLQADGCDFLCRCGERQEAKMYRGIDDQLLNPETTRDERDDRLLPM